MKRWAGVLCALTLLSACDGCSEKERASPLAHIEKDADAVFELKDVAGLRELPPYIEKHLGSVVTKPQIASLREELTLTIGFDPTSAEGLASAGLAKNGAVAASLAADGSGALWLVPVADAKKLRPTLDKQLKARAGADKVKQTKAGDVEITTLSNEFGPDVVERAAYAFAKGYLFLAFGATATKRVQEALSRKSADSVLEHPEYKALTKALGDDYHARIIAPAGGAALKGAMKLAAQLAPSMPIPGLPLEKEVRGAGWNIALKGDALRVKGRVRLTDAGKAAATKVFSPKTAVGPGVVSLDLPDTVVYVQAAVDPDAMIATLAPDGTPSRARLDAVFGRIRTDVDIDVGEELLPLLSGHASLALGVGNLEGKAFRELVGNPRGVVWTAFALGAEDAKSIVAKESKLDEGLTKRNLEVSPRKFNNIDVRSVRAKGTDAALVETFALPKAWVFSNEPAISDRIILNGGGSDRLNGKSGVAVELRMRTFAAQLAKFDQSTLPLLWRGMVAKGLDLVKLFEQAEARVVLADDGLDVTGGLVFAK